MRVNMKTVESKTSRAMIAVVIGLTVAAGTARSATYTWDAGGSPDNNLALSANWAGDPTVNFLTGGTHDLVFGTAGNNVNMSGTGVPSPIDVNSITYTRAISLDNGSGGASGKETLVRSGGITITSDVISGTPTMNVDWKLRANQAIANNSSQNFQMLRNVQTSSGTWTLTNNGAGTGWVRISNVTGNVVQDSLTSALSVGQIDAISVSGNLTIKKGLFGWQNQRTYNPAGGTITLGYAAATATDWGAIQLGAFGLVNNTVNVGDVLTVSCPIVMAGTAGTYTIRSGKNTYGGSMAARNHTINWTGGVTGSNSLYLENTTDAYGADNIRFSTGAINMSGKLIHVGAGTGTTMIDSVIGANVTEVIQNSATSKLVLGGTSPNLYTGNTTILAGTLQVTNSAALPSTTSVLIAAGGAKLELGVNATVDTLSLAGVQQRAGTYGSTSSTADHKDNTYFASTGVLTAVGPPPGGTVILLR